jgi:transcriptional regulator with XRE-family HTH domain
MQRLEGNVEQVRLGARLRAGRTAAGLSRRDLAAQSGLGERRIGAVERGAAAITALELWALAAQLNLPIEALFAAIARPADGETIASAHDIMAGTDDGAALAEAFVKLKTPRLRRHLVQLAQELVQQELRGA